MTQPTDEADRTPPQNPVADAYHERLSQLSGLGIEKVLDQWKARRAEGYTGGGLTARLRGSLPQTTARKSIVFFVYENPLGAGGGIRAVAIRLPDELEKMLKAGAGKGGMEADIIRLSPLHTRVKTFSESALDSAVAEYQAELRAGRIAGAAQPNTPAWGQNPIPLVVTLGNGDRVPVRLYKTSFKGQVWHLFRADGFFEADGGVGGTDPYVYGDEDREERDSDDSKLLRDSLFAAQAVPEILINLGRFQDVIVHAHDWECAGAALTVKKRAERERQHSQVRSAVLLTLHNPYDHAVSNYKLFQICGGEPRDWECPGLPADKQTTMLSRMIPLSDGPVSIVSHQMALEVLGHPLQTGVFAGHLREVLRLQGLAGIDNGLFVKLPEPRAPEAAKPARRGKSSQILREKMAKRQQMLESLEAYITKCHKDKSPETPIYGFLNGGPSTNLQPNVPTPLSRLPEDVPVFMMNGRLDPGQKGYDLAARLIESIPPGQAKFILTPMSSLANDPDVGPFMDQLKSLAEERKGDLVVLAHRMVGPAYQHCMAGATYSLWPSLYEPFGSVTEYYCEGTPVVAHAIGGLAQQVIDYSENPEAATGFLYRSYHPSGESYQQLEAQYRKSHEAGPAARMSVPIYQRQFEAFAFACASAVALYRHQREDYARILANLYPVCKELGWEKPVRDYLEWYGAACA